MTTMCRRKSTDDSFPGGTCPLDRIVSINTSAMYHRVAPLDDMATATHFGMKHPTFQTGATPCDQACTRLWRRFRCWEF